VPHAWECGLLFESTQRTFFCGDLFTQGGSDAKTLTREDILGPSEAFRRPLGHFAHAPQTRRTLQRSAADRPQTLACVHGVRLAGRRRRVVIGLRRVAGL
jgi:hypothetical protein